MRRTRRTTLISKKSLKKMEYSTILEHVKKYFQNIFRIVFPVSRYLLLFTPGFFNNISSLLRTYLLETGVEERNWKIRLTKCKRQQISCKFIWNLSIFDQFGDFLFKLVQMSLITWKSLEYLCMYVVIPVIKW